MMMMTDEEIEMALLLKAVQLKYGYDFTNYAQASLTRRIRKNLKEENLGRAGELILKILDDPDCFKRFLANLSVNVTEMFRNPAFYLALRTAIAPYLKTYPFLKIWSAGTATGLEAYSLAVLLTEEGLYDNAVIYATDFDEDSLAEARKGIYAASMIKKSTVNYQHSGGKESFGKYFRADYNAVIFRSSLKKNIVFANHNLVCDGVFGEMNLILCRNVLIYFNRALKNKVLKKFYDSLLNNGFLCLGGRETIEFSSVSSDFVTIDKERKIYQKRPGGVAKEKQ